MPHSAVSETKLRAESQTEFFDRHPALPIVLLLLFPIALQVPLWLLGLSTDPKPTSFDGKIALQLHAGGQGNMEFKDLWIRDLSHR